MEQPAPIERRSPFPGMGPYLEDPAGWGGVHGGLISLLRTTLNRQLGPDLVADIDTTVYIITPTERRWAFLDVYAMETGARATMTSPGRIAAPIQVVLAAPEMIEQPAVIIRDQASRVVVTLIEVLSPINKAPADTRARADFLRKRAYVMASDSHWVEIDLLRAGERPHEVRDVGAYHVLTKRSGSGIGGLWPIGLRDRVPRFGIPLHEETADIPIDLQVLFDQLYAEGRYADLIDHPRPPPPPPLSLSDRQWLADRIVSRQPHE